MRFTACLAITYRTSVHNQVDTSEGSIAYVYLLDGLDGFVIFI